MVNTLLQSYCRVLYSLLIPLTGTRQHNYQTVQYVKPSEFSLVGDTRDIDTALTTIANSTEIRSHKWYRRAERIHIYHIRAVFSLV